jgi:hypothetical protein
MKEASLIRKRAENLERKLTSVIGSMEQTVAAIPLTNASINTSAKSVRNSASRSGSTDRKKTENRTGQDRNGPDHRSWSLIFENERPQKTGLNEPVRTGSNR